MSFPRYPVYKDSGVEWLGEVPVHWEVQRLKHVASVSPSNVDKKAYDDQPPVQLCNYTDVYYNDRIAGEMSFMAATATAEQIRQFALRRGDTLITKDSETSDDIAVSAYVPQDLPAVVCGYHLAIVRPFEQLGAGFIKRLFDSTYLRSSVAVLANGLTRVGLSQHDLDNLLVPWPPDEDRETITVFLDSETAKIDGLIAEQERLIDLLKEKRQAVISHAVTKGLNPEAPMKPSGIDWLGDVPAHWEVQRVKHLTRSIEQGWSPQCEAVPAEGEEWGVLKVGCVNGGRFNPLENKLLSPDLQPEPGLALKANDLLVSRANTRELVGGAAVVDRDYPHLMLCDKLYRLRFENGRCTPQFVTFYLGSTVARGQIELSATGASASMVNIGQTAILDLPMATPPLVEQEAIAAFLASEGSATDRLIAEAESTIGLLNERRTALISAAVTGQIDVRGSMGRQSA